MVHQSQGLCAELTGCAKGEDVFVFKMPSDSNLWNIAGFCGGLPEFFRLLGHYATQVG